MKNTYAAVRILGRLLAEHPGVRVVMLGSGKKRIQRALKKAGGAPSSRFSILGHQSQDVVARILGESMALFLPSRSEAFPLAAGEAVCMGCTVIGGPLEALCSLARGGFSESGDPAGSAAAIPDDPATRAERADLDQRIATLEEELARDEERLKQLISEARPEAEQPVPLYRDPELEEIAKRFPQIQADLAALRARRRSLDLPENLFSMHVLSKPDGRRVVRFLGRGWGHGVGLCQNGSYGLARAGRSQ